MKDIVEAQMTRIPLCDFCTDPAGYDAQMLGRTAWAYFCEYHFGSSSVGRLGTGYGQRLVKVA